MPPNETSPVLVCDTCQAPASTVSRVVVDRGYDRSNARPLYNCPECFEKKLEQRLQCEGDESQITG